MTKFKEGDVVIRTDLDYNKVKKGGVYVVTYVALEGGIDLKDLSGRYDPKYFILHPSSYLNYFYDKLQKR